jgi:hypothetical protein
MQFAVPGVARGWSRWCGARSRLLALVLAGVFAATLVSPGTALSDPPALQSTTTSCNTSPESYFVDPPGALPNAGNYLYSLTSSGMSGWVITNWADQQQMLTFAAGDKIWGDTTDGELELECITPGPEGTPDGSALVQWYLDPNMPATFSGVLSAGSSSAFEVMLPSSYETWDQWEVDIAGQGVLDASGVALADGSPPVTLPYQQISNSNVPTPSTPPSDWIYPFLEGASPLDYSASGPAVGSSPVAFQLTFKYDPFNPALCDQLLDEVGDSAPAPFSADPCPPPGPEQPPSTAPSTIPPVAGAPGRLPTLLRAGGGRFLVRPSTIWLSGDGSSLIGGLNGRGPHTNSNWPRWAGRITWSAWTTTQALGTGVNWLDNCKPSCASGRYYAYPVKLRAYDPLGGHFTRLAIRRRYHGRWGAHTLTLRNLGGVWYWT